MPHDSSTLIKLQATGCRKGTQGISQPVPQAHNTITHPVPLHTHCNYTPNLAQSYTHYHDPDPVPLYTQSVTYPRPSHSSILQHTVPCCTCTIFYHVLPMRHHAIRNHTTPACTCQGSGLRSRLGSAGKNMWFVLAKAYGPGLKSRLR